ncbi:hypothetical protein PF010_g23681 [Phytophthora fragariae]|uniref:Integrase catalytic domain-containing protein n=1 Tax=Phytophthora fragariae TaxID=53985 RepID=A0A6G0K5G6_9STRA|nr:hypothetical protein PF010_g23681 [Phytophthora fragariae]KAE9185745.1 hypothetical protein PF004_g23273 [Phytophthora fragariae]
MVPPNEMEWILDSGAQVNVTGDLALLNNVKNRKQVELLEGATGGFGRVELEGAVLMPVVNVHSGETETRLLENVRYSPGTKINLISQTYMQFKCGYKLIVSDDQLVTWLVKPTMKLKFVMRDGLYRMRVERRNKLVLSAQKPSADSNVMELLHNRLNHVAMDTIKEMVASKVDMGVKVNTRDLSFYECVPCIESKIKRMTYSRNPRRATRPLEKLSADICTINEVSADKSTMFLLVMDEFSRYKWAYLLKSKADASDHLKHLILKLEKKFKPLSVMLFHADGGGEFISNAFTVFCANQGVELNYTHADSPEENGIVKRNNGIIVSRVRSMLDATRLPNSLWGEALLHAVDTLNVCPTGALQGRSSHEVLYGNLPSLRSLRTWGCMTHVHSNDSSRERKEKLATRVRTCILLGYTSTKKGYKFLDVVSGAVVTARGENVRFHEAFTIESNYVGQLVLNTFFHVDFQLSRDIPVVRIKSSMDTYIKDDRASQIEIVEETTATATGNAPPAEPASSSPASTDMRVGTKRKRSDEQAELLRAACVDEDWVPTRSATAECEPRPPLPKRQRKPSVRLRDYVVNSVHVHEEVVVPTTYKQARASRQWKKWREAMLEELASLKVHGTWRLVRRREMRGRKAITCRWVYAVKRDERGQIKRYKARLVIHGFKQLAGLEYTETYAPVIRFDTIRAAIYFALQRGWAILQYDVKTAFLYGHLDEVIFMEQPPGFQSEPDAYVCHLQRSLYGLRQTPNVWNRTLHKALERLGFSRLDSDYGLYAQKMGESGEISMLLTVYVDDILLLGPTDLCRSVAQQLAEEFELTALGPVKYLLGVENLIDPLRKEVVYCQRQHVKDILKRFNMESCNGCATPEGTTPQQLRAPMDKSYLPYRELVGSLQYLVSASRPDIAHGVRNLGKYLSNYTYEHYFMAKRVLRYLASTVDYGLVNTIGTGSRVTVTCFMDVDYANDVDDRKSISGYVTMLDGNVVSYASRKQEINAQSTTEAEYVAMNEGTKDLLWMLGLCLELN